MSTSRKTVSDLKQSFEANNSDSTQQPSPKHHHKQDSQKTSFLTNMMNAQKKLAKVQQTAQPSIDAILGTAASVVPATLRPSTAKHPSWIGPKPPERPITPGGSRMEQPVTINFYLTGTQPPVYIATDLSKPQWRPVEMDYTQDEEGEYRFSMTFEAEEGEYQYKLRLGPGDWWICDDSVPKVTDDAGNENNLVVLKASTRTNAAHAAAPDGFDVSTADVPEIKLPERQDSIQVDDEHTAPLMPHERASVDDSAHRRHHLDHEHSQQNLHEPEAQSPLFRHESLAPPPLDDKDNEDDNDDDDGPESPPLLRHESIAPSSQEQEQSPLFHHESIAIDNKQHHDGSRSSSPRVGGRKHSNGSIPEEADPNDPTLERFPTDHRGIIESLDRTRRSMQEDETSEEQGSPRRHSPSSSIVEGTSPSLPSVREDDVEESGEEQSEDNRDSGNPAESDPNADVPQVMISEPQERPLAPMTPPMTPKEEQAEGDQSQLEDTSSEERVNSPMSVQEKVEHIKKRAHHKAKHAAESSLPAIAIGIAIALAAASAALAIWYIKTKSDNVVL